MQQISMLDLARERKILDLDVHGALSEVLETSQFIGSGPELESELQEYLGTNLHCVTVANGTDALELVYRECKHQRPHATEVWVPAFTFSATASAAEWAGLTVKYIDVDPTPGSYVVTPHTLRQAMRNICHARIAAVVLVSLYGQVPDFKAIRRILPDDIPLIEDAAQSFGSSGSFGSHVDFACTSFYPSKNLGCYGDGGAIFCHPRYTKSLRGAANHARGLPDGRIGRNSRMDGFQAAVLRKKLQHFDRIKLARQQVAEWYEKGLADLKTINLPQRESDTCFSVYTIEVNSTDRKDIQEFLKIHGVQSRVYYDRPLSYACPTSLRKSQTVLSLPIFPFMTETECGRVCDLLRAYFLN